MNTGKANDGKITLLEFTPKKRPVLPGDPFFEEGDLHCNLLLKQLPFIDDLEKLISRYPEFHCDVAGCSIKFSNLCSYESHYNSCHRHSCKYCKRFFPSGYLLELHIMENHDMYFQVSAIKNKKYLCLVESCSVTFCSQKSRKDHLVTVHKYPADFRFNRPNRATKKQMSTLDVSIILDAMEITPSHVYHEKSRARMPKNFCFGRGSQRAFQRGACNSPGCGGYKQKIKKTPNKNVTVNMDQQTHNNEVEMTDNT